MSRHKGLPSKELIVACSELLSRKEKLESQLRNLRAALLLSGNMEHVLMLDKAWAAFAGNQGGWPMALEVPVADEIKESAETIPDAITESPVPPLRLHSYPSIMRPSRLKKESA